MRAPRSVSAFVFLGAVLLFSLEPMSGRLLLPRFGGAFHVWTSALMFFQGALVVGYAYAHLVAERIGRLHLGVVGLPLLFLPIGLGDEPSESASVLAILGLLMRHVAVPFVVLSTTSIVAQRWMTSAGKEPFWLYALSNAGSLGALLGYALIVEPFVGLEVQRRAWSVQNISVTIDMRTQGQTGGGGDWQRGLRLPAAVAGQPQPATVVAGEGSQHTQEAEEGA